VTDEDPTGRARRMRMIGGRSVPSLVLTVACAAVAMVALVDLAIRSAVRLDLRWDTFSYHLPFAALRGGLSIPYDMNDTIRPLFEGFPPLPDLVQGLLWRLTGSVNATGVVNFIAFGLFLMYCHKVLRAPFWLVALISLTAPMVLIHTTVSYVDLFGNSFLAIGVSSCLYAYLFPERPSRAVVVGGLAALATAAWSKELLVPVVAVMLIFFAAIVLRSTAADRFSRRQAAAIILVFATLAATPYVKNLVAYGNPIWPTRVPIVGALFPYAIDATTTGAETQRPAVLIDAPQAEVFVQSLFEINVPTQYQNRPRWIIDQGNASDGFRMGGFWGFGVIVYLLVTFGMLIAYRRRAGIVASVAGIGLLCFVAVLPQSNELRYYMFIPLTWAATIGMLYPKLRDRFPRAGLGLLVLVLALFGHMVSQNWTYYQIEKIDYQDAAVAWGAAAWWPYLQQGQTYCVVDMLPIGIMMTGPTMSEYSIVDRSKVSLCPAGTIVVTTAGIQGPYRPKSEAQLASDALAAGLKAHQAGNLTEAAKDYQECLKHDTTNKYCLFDLGVIAQTQNRPTEAEKDYRLALVTDPNFGPALFNLAIIRTQAGATQEAIGIYQQFVKLNPNDASGHLHLGLLLRATGDTTNGDAEIAKALQLNPKLTVPTSSPSSP
jgi:Tetratricopeptide repeat